MDFEKISLTDGQKDAIYYMKSGRNVFITGSAGVGKSFILGLYFKIAVKKYEVKGFIKQAQQGCQLF